MDKEFMNAICQKGKGTRGGKVSRQRKHPNATRTRRPSQKQLAMTDAEISILQQEVSSFTCYATVGDVQPPNTLVSKAAWQARTPSVFWRELTGDQKLQIIKANKLHREAVELVYRILHRVVTEGLSVHIGIMLEKYEELLKASSEKRQFRKIRSLDDLVRLIARLALKFDLPEGKSDYNLVWRITGSIRHFLQNDVCPGDISKLPGGIDDWPRSDSKTFRSRNETTLEARALTEDSDSFVRMENYLNDGEDNDKDAKNHSGVDSILNCLRQCVEQGIRPTSGIMLIGLLLDENEPHEAKVVLQAHLPTANVAGERLREVCKIVAQTARELLTGSSSVVPLYLQAKARRRG